MALLFQGDSGGPLVYVSNDSVAYVVGLVSSHKVYGEKSQRTPHNCKDNTVAEYYTNVYNFRDWITETIQTRVKSVGRPDDPEDDDDTPPRDPNGIMVNVPHPVNPQEDDEYDPMATRAILLDPPDVPHDGHGPSDEYEYHEDIKGPQLRERMGKPNAKWRDPEDEHGESDLK